MASEPSSRSDVGNRTSRVSMSVIVIVMPGSVLGGAGRVAGVSSGVGRGLGSLAGVPELGAAGDDMVDARREGRLGGDEQAEPADLVRGAHAPEELRRAPLFEAALRVAGRRGRLAPERGVDVARGDGVHADA